jgi:hypothetical protein
MRQRPDNVALDDQVVARRGQVERLDVGLDKTDREPLSGGLAPCPSQHGGCDIDAGYAMALFGKEQREKTGPQPTSRTSSGSASARPVMRQRYARASSSVTRPWLASRSKSAARRFQCRRTNSFTASMKLRLPATSYRLQPSLHSCHEL